MIPLALGVVLLILVLLRSLVAPLLLIGTVVLSFFAALGASRAPSRGDRPPARSRPARPPSRKVPASTGDGTRQVGGGCATLEG